MYKYLQSVRVGFWIESEVEKVDEVLRGEGHGATFGIVSCAGMIRVLQTETKETQPSILNAAVFSDSS